MSRFLYILGFILLLPMATEAASVALMTEARAVTVGDVITIVVKLDPQGEPINGVDGSVRLSPGLMLERIEYGASPVSLWLTRPHEQRKGVIEFAGIIPGGYLGNLSAQWTGYRPGELMTLYVRAVEAGTAEAVLDSGTTLSLNDEQGTLVPFATSPLALVVQAGAAGRIPDTALPTDDRIPPSPFEVRIIRDEALFSGAYAVAFSAEDEQSGVARFEIAESRNPLGDGTDLEWREAQSPVRLDDQLLTSGIYVKAIDGAGNERVEYLGASFSPVADILAGALAFIGILILLVALRRLRFW